MPDRDPTRRKKPKGTADKIPGRVLERWHKRKTRSINRARVLMTRFRLSQKQASCHSPSSALHTCEQPMNASDLIRYLRQCNPRMKVGFVDQGMMEFRGVVTFPVMPDGIEIRFVLTNAPPAPSISYSVVDISRSSTDSSVCMTG